MKKLLILTAGFGEGHNAAARGIREGLLKVAPGCSAQVRDLFSETFGPLNQLTCRAYLHAINRAPAAWGWVYSWIDARKKFRAPFRLLFAVRERLRKTIEREQPHVVVAVYPAYAHLLDELYGHANGSLPKRVVCVTDSITVNAVWFHCSADHFLLANDETAAVLMSAGVSQGALSVVGFPVDPEFAVGVRNRQGATRPPWRILYMVNPCNTSAPALATRLAQIPGTDLTITVGRDDQLLRAIDSVRAMSTRKFRIIGWTTELPNLLREHDVLITKAGGATVQEALAAACPIIINQIVPGQEQGNARFVLDRDCGALALTDNDVLCTLERAFADEGALLRHWTNNMEEVGRPAASLEIARFLLDL